MNPISMDSTMPRLGRAREKSRQVVFRVRPVSTTSSVAGDIEIDTERAVASWEAEVAENMAASAALEANA
jgi:hypothetical protein